MTLLSIFIFLCGIIFNRLDQLFFLVKILSKLFAGARKLSKSVSINRFFIKSGLPPAAIKAATIDPAEVPATLSKLIPAFLAA